MKIFIVIILVFLTCLPSDSQIITGGVEYSVEEARSSVLQNPQAPLSKQVVRNYILDTDRVENLTALLQGITKLNDRTLAYFSDGSYGVNYADNPKQVWYYTNNGILMHSEIRTSLEYPYKSYKYTPDGVLVNMSLRVSEDETFIFNRSGGLIAHWVGENCYDENNSIIMTRKRFN